MRSVTPLSLDGHCHRCYLRVENCLCSIVPHVHTATEVVIVRHRNEQRLTSNTGRLAALCLDNCRILDYGGGLPFDESQLPREDAVLLYPGSSSSPLSRPPKHLIVLDSTFRQARRMYKRLSILRELPQLALPIPSEVPNRLRQPPRPDGLSTIEAIAAGLMLLENVALGAPLLDCYASFVERKDEQRGRVRVPASCPTSPDQVRTLGDSGADPLTQSP